MTKEEFYTMIERAEEDYQQGRTHRILPGESLNDFLKRMTNCCGHSVDTSELQCKFTELFLSQKYF